MLDSRIVTWLVAVALTAGCGGDRLAPDVEDFRDRAARTVERSRRAVERARTLAGRQAIDLGPGGSYDVRTLRFADCVDRAVHTAGVAADGKDRGSPPVRVWTAGAGAYRELRRDRPITLEWPPVAAAEVGAVVVRAAADDNAFVRLRVVLADHSGSEAAAVRLDLIADGEMRRYVVDLRGVLGRSAASNIGRCVVSLESGRQARVGSVELAGGDWRYEAAWGRSRERIGHETRTGVFLRGEGTLSWPLAGVWRDARLSFGLAQALVGRAARVVVSVDDPTRRRPLVETVLEGGTPWADFELELGDRDLSGAALTVTVEAVDDRDPGVVFWAAPVLWQPPDDRLNIVVVLEDALRASRMSVYGHDRRTTPFKARFFADGVRFSRCLSQATKTRFSCPSFMTSLRPLATGVYGVWNRNPRLHESYVTLAEVLAAHGWATGSFLQNANAGPDNGLDQGFDRVVENIPGRAGQVYGGAVLEWIEANRDRSFFAYLHVADPHAPYDPPASARGWYEELLTAHGGPRWQDPLWVRDARRALYDGEVVNNDRALPTLVHRLEQLGLLDRTMIVFISDHGEHLGEHGLWDHVPPSYLQVIHVPLMMRLPAGWARPAVIDEPVELLDLMPTLLDAAGIDGNGLPLHGRSLMPAVRGTGGGQRAAIAVVQEAMFYHRPDEGTHPGSLVWDRWHLVGSSKVPTALFDHRADPDEDRPLRVSRQLSSEAAALRVELARLDGELRELVAGDGSEEIIVDAENLENLAALGYLDD